MNDDGGNKSDEEYAALMRAVEAGKQIVAAEEKAVSLFSLPAIVPSAPPAAKQ